MRILFFLGLPAFIAFIAFIMFFIGAKKVQKNSLLWGVWGALSFLIPIIVLGPIAWSMLLNSVRAAGRDAIGPLFFSYGAITVAVGIFASVLVYKKILVKPTQLTVDKNAFVFCSECGTQCPANMAFCNKCGCKIGGA